jgi:3-oxoadipate enol-lactonase
LLLLHAGVADRRMWDGGVWHTLTAQRDVVRVDLPGFGESAERPAGSLTPWRDVAEVLDRLGIPRAHLVGASFGAGVAVELALADPGRVASLLLAAPGGSLIPAMTPQLRAFAHAENAALDAGELDAAVEANLLTWVDGPDRSPDRVSRDVRDRVGAMQRLAFELTADWDDVEEEDLDPAALERLAEVDVPTLVLTGGLDLDAIAEAADAVVGGVRRSRRVDWPDVAHLPSMERPADFAELVLDWLAEVEAGATEE